MTQCEIVKLASCSASMCFLAQNCGLRVIAFDWNALRCRAVLLVLRAQAGVTLCRVAVLRC